MHAKVANSNPTNYIFLRSAINTLSIEHSCFVTALIEYLDRFNAVQDERQSVVKGLLVKIGVS